MAGPPPVKGPQRTVWLCFCRTQTLSIAPFSNPEALTMSPTPRPGVMDITAYVGGRAHVPGVKRVFKLSSNESPLGPSPAVTAAMEQAKASLHIYPEGSARILREAIGEVHGLDPDRIVCSGDGS